MMMTYEQKRKRWDALIQESNTLYDKLVKLHERYAFLAEELVVLEDELSKAELSQIVAAICQVRFN